MAAEPEHEERINQSPGMPITGKLGASTKLEIMEALRRGDSVKLKHIEACKLLWARGEVKYDGKEFYV